MLSIASHFHTFVFIMQHNPTPDKKRKTELADSSTGPRVPGKHLMLVQIVHERLYTYLAEIDPELDRMIYEDLLEFEKSKIDIHMNNYEPESLYTLYEGNVARPDRHIAWVKFFHDISCRKNPDKSKYFTLNRESLCEVQKARWFVSFCSR